VDVRITTIDPARVRKKHAHMIVAGGGIGALGLAVLMVTVIATIGTGHGLGTPLGRSRDLRVIDTDLVDGAIDPSVVLLEPGAVQFRVRNDGSTPRRFAIQGPGVFSQTDDLEPGASASLDLTLAQAGRYRLQVVSPSGDPLSSGMLEVHQ